MLLLKKGILTTIQDAGRMGHAAIGVNFGGAMDYFSYRVLNILLGNPQEYPVLEMHFPAAEIRFEEECQFATYGADFDPHLNHSPLSNGKIYSARPGDTLRFKKKYNGERCYFGIRGKLDLPLWLQSFSQNSALKFPELPLEIPIINSSPLSRKFGICKTQISNKEIRFVPEFEYSELNEKSKLDIFQKPFSLSKDANRMGLRLHGVPLFLKTPKEMLSSAVTKGSIQLLPDGKIIILTADAQTTGGYPKLGYVCTADLSSLAQFRAGESFSLRPITQEESVKILLEQEEFFKSLELTLNTL